LHARTSAYAAQTVSRTQGLRGFRLGVGTRNWAHRIFVRHRHNTKATVGIPEYNCRFDTLISESLQKMEF